MRFRNICLLAAVASLASLFQSAFWFYVVAKITWRNGESLSHLSNGFDLLHPLMLALFLSFLYREASQLAKAETRANIALVLLVLTVLGALGKLWSLALYIYVLSRYTIDADASLLAMQVLELVRAMFWIAFLAAFSKRKGTMTSHFTARVAGALAFLTLCSSVWGGLQYKKAWASVPHSSLVWNSAVLLLWSVAMLLFFAAIWRRWNRDLPIHQNIVC